MNEAQRLAGLQLKVPSQRANAMLAEILRLRLHADYLALIDKRDFTARAEMNKARELAEQLLSAYPEYYDAYIAIGVENYLLSQRPVPVRCVMRMSGVKIDKQQALQKLRLTADHGRYLMPYARLLLAVAALRDGNRKRAHELLSWLAAHYPENGLYREELAKLR